MPEIEFFGLSFCKILEFWENFIEFLGNSSKFMTTSAKFWTLQACMCNFLVKLCRNFFCWAWVRVFILEFLNSWVFSPWVFFGRRPKKKADIIFPTTYIVKIYLKGLQGKPWHAVQRPGPGSLTRQSGWLQFHPGTQVNVRDGACPISKSQLFGFRKRYAHAAFMVLIAKNTKLIPKSFNAKWWMPTSSQ